MKLRQTGQNWGTEKFIKIGGTAGSARFLLNSGLYHYYEDNANPRSIRSFFWSAKKLVDNVVIKDFTPPIASISIYRESEAD